MVFESGYPVPTPSTGKLTLVWWRKAMHMLGLEDEVDYTDQNPVQRREPMPSGVSSQVGASRHSTVTPMTASGKVVSIDDATRPTPSRAARAEADGSHEETGSVRTVVRPVAVASNAKPHIVRPVAFNEAQLVADAFKVDQPVVMDLQDADRELARRLIDFASGLCYGLGGQMERLDTQVYLLAPSKVVVSEEERRRLRDRGYDS